MSRRVAVYGPAYLDRVIRVDRPLVDPASGPPLDQSIDGVSRFGAEEAGLILRDPSGFVIEIECPRDWPGPYGRIDLGRVLRPGSSGRRIVSGTAWQDDLGGMGAGFASALGGTLVSALGPESDPNSRVISTLLKSSGIVHRPIRIADRSADWTLLVTSGGHGDKLPVGFRGCHAALHPDQLAPMLAESCDVLVVAALPNHLVAQILSASEAPLRVFAPSTRNMVDAETPISGFAGFIDVLCCNRREWETLEDREEVAWRVSILAVTDGPDGSVVRFTKPTGDPGRISVASFPRSRPPLDTNRAGEAYASTLLATILDHGWQPGLGVIEEDLIREAAIRGSVAASLVLDRTDFGFPASSEIEDAIRLGRID